MSNPVRPSEALEVLAVAAIYDDRKESVVAAEEWAMALTAMGVTAREAAAAVRQHYIDAPDTRVRPGHLLPLIQAHRRRVGEAQAAANREAMALEPGRPAAGSPEAIAAHNRLRAIIVKAAAAREARLASERSTPSGPLSATHSPETPVSGVPGHPQAGADALRGREAGE